MSSAFTVVPFKDATIILPVINETYSLTQTFETIRATCAEEDINEYLIVVCQRTTAESLAVCEQLLRSWPARCRLHVQKLPFIGGAMQEAFALARGSHTVMMSTDLETDPAVIQNFIRIAKERPDAVVTASRWLKGGDFKGYHPVKLVANFLFQKMFALLYWTHLTDLTYAFRIFPTALLHAISWEELKHPFFLETVIKPLRLCVHVIEIPTVWKTRTEGDSQNTFMANFAYFRIALRVRFSSKNRILGVSGDTATDKRKRT